MAEQECIFCRIGRGEVPSEFFYRDEVVFVIGNINPEAPVHLLVIPFAHVEALAEEPGESLATLHALFAGAAGGAREAGVANQGYRLVVNQGPNAGQEVTHLHMHLLAGRRLGGMG
jgi:histidine triad (HIT) family protein